MRKSEVEIYSGNPALNVKCRRFGPHISVVQERFKCSETEASKALEYAWDSAVHRFWDDINETAREILGPCQVQSAGRSGGWLVVDGLSSIESWDAIQLAKWYRFLVVVRDTIRDYASSEAVLEDIEANEWYKTGAEEYNFVDIEGKTCCIADMKQAAIAAGFGPVVRA